MNVLIYLHAVFLQSQSVHKSCCFPRLDRIARLTVSRLSLAPFLLGALSFQGR